MRIPPAALSNLVMTFGCFALGACSGSAPHAAKTGGNVGTRSGGAPGSGGASGSGGAPGSGGAGTGGAAAGSGGAGVGGLATGGSSEATGGGGGPIGGGGGQAGEGGAAGMAGGGSSGAGAGGVGGGVPCGAPTSTCVCVGFRPPADHPATTDYDLTTADIVVDKVSGLTWERNAAADGGLMPCPEVLTGCPSNSNRVDAHCVASRTGGFSDWRLPTVLQLTSITDFQASNPAVNAAVFLNTPAEYFWTSTPVFGGSHLGSATSFWTVNTRDGSTTNGNPNVTSPVRCVRAPAAQSCFPKAERFQPSPISSVLSTIDRTTGLTWQVGRSPQPLTWAAAKDYCTNQGSRLPSVKELVSLVDFDRAVPPAIDTATFPDTPSEEFWTVTPAAGPAGDAMKVSFTYGGAFRSPTSGAKHVRCVR